MIRATSLDVAQLLDYGTGPLAERLICDDPAHASLCGLDYHIPEPEPREEYRSRMASNRRLAMRMAARGQQ